MSNLAKTTTHPAHPSELAGKQIDEQVKTFAWSSMIYRRRMRRRSWKRKKWRRKGRAEDDGELLFIRKPLFRLS